MGSRLRQSGRCLPAWIILWAWALSVLASDATAPAQEASAPPGRAGEASTGGPAADQDLPEEILPKISYLKDKDGHLVAVPGISFEQFMELWKLKNQLPQQNRHPPFSIEDLTFSGSASGDRAELVARYTVTVLDSGWVGVPLRLNDAVLREPAYDGPGEHVLRCEPERDGYVVWIRAEPGKTHHITVKLLAAVSQIGPESHLRLSVPRAAMSQLHLQVPVERALAKVSEGSTLESTRALEHGKTELNAIGLSGEFDIAWHGAQNQVASLPTILEATGALAIRVDGRSVNTDARLTVRSLGGEFDRFRVRLPPGADYVGSPVVGASVVAVDAASAKGKLYEIKLDKKTTGPVEISLATERIHNSPQADEMLELAGFEVLGAVRQSGTIGVRVEGNWQILWGETNHVTQVEELAGPLRRDDWNAAFEYFAQPYALPARVLPQKTRVRVQPEYAVLVGSEEAQLSGRLKYTIRGAKVRALEIELPGWEVDSVGPANLVNVDAAVTSQTAPLVIPLLQASSGELELTLEAHRKISADAQFELDLPRPHGEAIAQANVAVLPADNVELALQLDETTGLAPQTVRPQIKLPENLQDPLYFRTEGDAARLVATINVHEQSISTAVSTQLDVDERETQVEERLAFRIAYEPADHLTLSVPRALRPDRLTITLDGQRLLPIPLRERTAGEQGEVVPMRVALPTSRIGRCDLQVNYTLRHEKLSSTGSTRLDIPLVIPGDGQLTSNELFALPRTGISLAYPEGPWTEDPRSRQAASGLALSARRAIAEVALAATSKERPVQSATTIDRAWIQTRLTDNQRQDRAVYRLTTSEPRLQISLPSDADMGLVELEVDGRRVVPEGIRQHELILPISGTIGGQHILEMRYHFAERQPTGSLALACPRIESALWVRQLYWQLVLPANEHLLSAPEHFTREFRWVWSDIFWQRLPSWEQRELEGWVGAPPAGDSVRLTDETEEQYAARLKDFERSTNRYLFSTVGSVEPLSVYTLSRARLVLWGSLPLLLCGLALIYLPAARHPAVLFALAVLVAAGSLIDPEAAVLLAQASSLGLVLAGVALFLARMAARPAPLAPILSRGSSKAILERGGTEIYHRAPAGAAPGSTSTDPLVSTSAPEGES